MAPTGGPSPAAPATPCGRSAASGRLRTPSGLPSREGASAAAGAATSRSKTTGSLFVGAARKIFRATAPSLGLGSVKCQPLMLNMPSRSR